MRKLRSFTWDRLAVCLLMVCLQQVVCQTNVTNCDVIKNNTPCCLQLCNITQYLGNQCLDDCPQNMKKQNVTKNPSLFVCNQTGSDNANSSDTVFDILCWDKCPNGTFLDGEWCNTCHEECTTCTGFGNSISNCTCKHVIKNGACVQSCGSGYYSDVNNTCQKCNDLCSHCNDSGTDLSVCTCKIISNNTCVETCPSGYDNDGGTCTEAESNDDDKIVIIAAAAGGGGGLLIIIIVVVIVCCCCRRTKKRQKTRMSTIIEDRDVPKSNTDDIQLPTRANKKKNKRPNYENMQKMQDADIAAGAQRTLDKKYRYVKDPTETMKSETPVEVASNDQEIYENNETITRHKNIGDKLSRQWKKSKKSIANRLSRAGGNNKSSKPSGQSNSAFEAEPSSGTEGASYMVMSNVARKEPENTQEEYMDLSPAGRQDADFQQEDYEALTAPGTENTEEEQEQELYENYNNSAAASPGDEEDLDQEDYENFQPDLIRRQTVKAETQNTQSGDDNDDLEDYENAPPRAKYIDEPDYQNVASFRKPPH